jgi:hypothetical protein
VRPSFDRSTEVRAAGTLKDDAMHLVVRGPLAASDQTLCGLLAATEYVVWGLAAARQHGCQTCIERALASGTTFAVIGRAYVNLARLIRSRDFNASATGPSEMPPAQRSRRPRAVESPPGMPHQPNPSPQERPTPSSGTRQ